MGAGESGFKRSQETGGWGKRPQALDDFLKYVFVGQKSILSRVKCFASNGLLIGQPPIDFIFPESYCQDYLSNVGAGVKRVLTIDECIQACWISH